jgi:lipoate-protein ligase B
MGDFCQIQWLGRLKYETVLGLQKELVAQRAARSIPNTLLLVEHPHTFTIGIDGHRDHLLINRDELSQLDIDFHQVDRGGSIMYHGPGQLAVYPILNLRDYEYSYHRYIELLESVIIRALSAFKIHAFRQPGQRGIWVLPGRCPVQTPKWAEADDPIARIGSIGVKVNNDNITSYGFSINVDPDLEYFNLIIPRGIQGCHYTSLHQVLHDSIKIGAVLEPVIQSFCELFELESVDRMMLPVADRAFLPQATDLVR